MDVDNDLYSITGGLLKIAGLQFGVQGNVNAGNMTEVNLDINGQGLDIQSFLSLLPEEYRKYTENYKSNSNETLI